MAKIDLTSLEWRDLVFVGKNKNYGAYQMRADSAKRHNRAMLIVTLVAAVGFSLPTLIKMAIPEEKEIMTDVTQLSKLDKAEVKNEPPKPKALEPPPELKSTIKFTAPVIKKDEEVREDEEIKSQDDLLKNNTTISIADVKGNNEKEGEIIEDVKVAVTQTVEEEKPYTVVEQMPAFPGGDGELNSFLAKNIKYPVIAQENGIQGKVILRFQVSKTGKISDIVVLRSLDPSCDKEAIRVVGLLPTFIPGKQNGVNVPVYFVLPVSFRLQ